jgi:hypothetical protein
VCHLEDGGRSGKKSLTGAEEFWFNLAYEWKTPVDVMRSGTTSTQAFQYAEFVNRLWNRRDKTDHWNAVLRHDIHLLIAATLHADPYKELEDCYLKFEDPTDQDSPEAKERLRINRELTMKASQFAWRQAVGMDMEELEGWTKAGKPPEVKVERKKPNPRQMRTFRD